MRTPNNDRQLIEQPLVEQATTMTRRRDNGMPSPERRCILSGERDGRAALVRLALSPDAELVPDIMARAAGRGAWIGVDQDTLSAAFATGKLKGAVTRAFKGVAVHLADNLPEQIADGFHRHFLAQLGLATKAGVLLIGAERIDKAARLGAVALLAHASDAAEDGRRKRDQSWRVGEDKEGSALAGRMLPVDRAALSVALGRDNAVHIAILEPAWAARIENLLNRWQKYTGSARGSAEAAVQTATS